MTRNHDRPPLQDDRYAHATTAKRLASVISRAKQQPLIWAQEIHRMQSVGDMRPRKEVADAKDAAKIRASVKPALIPIALATVVRGENEQRVRSLIRAVRLLEASADAKDKHAAKVLRAFLANVWGISKACEIVAEGDTDDIRELREQWGDVQLPPADAKMGSWVADELLIVAAVRRLK